MTSESIRGARVEEGGHKLGVCCPSEFIQAGASKNGEKHCSEEKQIKDIF